jgi:6,7-dimethyl-8-ribityllumazine synthase
MENARPVPAGLRFAIVASRYYTEITDALVRAASVYLREQGCSEEAIELTWVPGAFELPWAVQVAARSGSCDAVIGLGCIIKGETPHDAYIAQAVAHGFTRIALDTGVPVAFGVITANTYAQAEARSGRDGRGKGREAAEAALAMARLARKDGRSPGSGSEA